ncbi:SRR1-like protein [Nilaparvata lugens]|uniref:SRR1-like protein n=1 Tax=Nilaparvata lugens TaxID=108931 RepID=UPI00193D8006|nr:SRR1-like protein [Nilaparvata lugens]
MSQIVAVRISSICEEVGSSSYCDNLVQVLHEILSQQKLDSFQDILCYGLGSVENFANSKYQFGLLVSLKEHFNTKVQIYDPNFRADDLTLFEHYDFEVIEENEFGKRSIDSATLVYLPHCPHELLNNFLWKNWDITSLRKCVIFGNSIGHFIDNTPVKTKETFKYICRVQCLVKEVSLENQFKFSDVFNDLSVHCISEENATDELECNFFDFDEEPNYDTLPVEYRKTLS